jgi:hypothetical protein
MRLLGNVLYWLFCVIAGLIVVATVWKWSATKPASWLDWWVLCTFALLAVASWQVGRALRYMLARS